MTDQDVFSAARWLDAQWNSTARAVGPDEVEWMCTTWGSGRGCGAWEETAIFSIVSEAFRLHTSRNYGRDEMVVTVPLSRFTDVATMVARLEKVIDDCPWLDVEAEGRELQVAAECLGLPVDEVAGNEDLLVALQLLE